MKKIAKPLLIICLCALCIVLILTSLITIQSRTIYSREAEDKLYYANQSYANEFNQIFVDIETLVSSLSVEAAHSFTHGEFQQDDNIFFNAKGRLATIIEDLLRENGNATGLFFTINPDLHEGRHEIYYSRNDEGDIEHVDTEALSPTWFLRDNPIVEWYFDAIEYGSYWGGLQWESSLQKYVSTYAIPVYDNHGVLVGVAGADILMSEVTGTVENMNIYGNGRTYLIDNEFELVAQNSDEQVSKRVFSEIRSHENSDPKPRTYYTDSIEDERLILTSTKLRNGWYIAMMQPEGDVFESLTDYRALSFILTLLSVAALIVIIIMVFKRAIMPVYKQLEDQEIYIINRDRQAELGEMVGNIAHQWKQPINAINISLLNVREDLNAELIDRITIAEHLERVQECLDTLAPTLDDFVHYLTPINDKETFNVEEEVRRATKLVDGSLKVNGIVCDITSNNDAYITGYKNEFCQSIINVVNNAIEAIVQNGVQCGTIKISIKHAPSMAVVVIENNGPHITKSVEKQIFKPYFTTKGADGGTGIGLYLVERIVVEHFSGSVSVQNTDDGVAFSIVIPLSEMEFSDE